MNIHHRNFFDVVMMAVDNDNYKNRYIFLDGLGVGGKSYLHNTIITHFESKDLVVLSVAWTIIGANLLTGRHTVHSMFKFPVPLNEDSTYNISGMLKHADLLTIRSAKIIVWDEITITPSYNLECMESMLGDITISNDRVGGKVILLSGDFRQSLPIVRHGSRTRVFVASIKSSKLWKYCQMMSLYKK